MSEPAEPLTDRAKWLRESREAISNGDKEELARHLKEKMIGKDYKFSLKELRQKIIGSTNNQPTVQELRNHYISVMTMRAESIEKQVDMFLDLHTKVKDQGLNIGVMVNAIYATMLLKSVEWQRNFIMFLNEKNFDFVRSASWNREILRAAEACVLQTDEDELSEAEDYPGVLTRHEKLFNLQNTDDPLTLQQVLSLVDPSDDIPDEILLDAQKKLPTYENLLALVGDVGDEHFEEVVIPGLKTLLGDAFSQLPPNLNREQLMSQLQSIEAMCLKFTTDNYGQGDILQYCKMAAKTHAIRSELAFNARKNSKTMKSPLVHAFLDFLWDSGFCRRKKITADDMIEARGGVDIMNTVEAYTGNINKSVLKLRSICQLVPAKTAADWASLLTQMDNKSTTVSQQISTLRSFYTKLGIDAPYEEEFTDEGHFYKSKGNPFASRAVSTLKLHQRKECIRQGEQPRGRAIPLRTDNIHMALVQTFHERHDDAPGGGVVDYLKLLNDLKTVLGPTFNFCLAGRAQTVKTLRCRGTFQGAGAQATFRYSPDGTKTFQLGTAHQFQEKMMHHNGRGEKCCEGPNLTSTSLSLCNM